MFKEKAMVKIEAVIRPSKLTQLKESLVKMGIHGLTVLEAGGFGRQRGHSEMFRGLEYMVDFIPKLMVVIVTSDDLEDRVVEEIRAVCMTGEVGDGKIFIYPVKDVVRIRTGEKGESAL